MSHPPSYPSSTAGSGGGGVGGNTVLNGSNLSKTKIDPNIILPHPAEDLSADDDLLSWILVDQLGALPNTKLGVHPQQVKFVGPGFKTEEVMEIVRGTVIKGNIDQAVQSLQEFHLIAAHLNGKTTDLQRERFIQHLRRYLLPLLPSSRVEVFTTPRYTAVTKHTELAVFATRPLLRGVILQELQGSVVPLPDAWREEMEIGEDFAHHAAEEEDVDSEYDSGESDGDDDDEEDGEGEVIERAARNRKERDEVRSRGARRSDRTKRRDFSIVWSGLKRCFQLFLGPARFLNHDCSPNVELLRQGKHVTFRVTKDIRVGDEITTFYGDNYFGRGNIECLCLTCEHAMKGGFTPKDPAPSRHSSRSASRDISAAPPSISSRAKQPSHLRKVTTTPALDGDNSSIGNTSRAGSAGPSRIGEDDSVSISTPSKGKGKGKSRSLRPDTESAASDSDHEREPEIEVESSRRGRTQRAAAKKIKPWAYLKRPKEILRAMMLEDYAGDQKEGGEEEEDLPEDFPRCGTCAKPLHERVWYANRYFDHCPRCIRHALIFNLPWPAHRPQDILEYPPPHLIPPNYMPKRISSIPLPTLSKKRPEPLPSPPPSPTPLTKEQKQQYRFRALLEMGEYMEESLRNSAWAAQDAEEQAIIARVEASVAKAKRKEEQRLKKAEERRKRDENSIKGSGVWSRYEYVSNEEWERRVAENTIVATGSRRAARMKAEEEEKKKRAELDAAMKKKKEQRKAAKERQKQAKMSLEEEIMEEDFDFNGEEPVAGPSTMTAMVHDLPDLPVREHREDEESSMEVYRLVEPSASRSVSSRYASPEKASPPVKGPPPRPQVSKQVNGKGSSTAQNGSRDGAEDKRGRGRPPGTGKHQKRQRAMQMEGESKMNRSPETLGHAATRVITPAGPQSPAGKSLVSPMKKPTLSPRREKIPPQSTPGSSRKKRVEPREIIHLDESSEEDSEIQYVGMSGSRKPTGTSTVQSTLSPYYKSKVATTTRVLGSYGNYKGKGKDTVSSVDAASDEVLDGSNGSTGSHSSPILAERQRERESKTVNHWSGSIANPTKTTTMTTATTTMTTMSMTKTTVMGEKTNQEENKKRKSVFDDLEGNKKKRSFFSSSKPSLPAAAVSNGIIRPGGIWPRPPTQ